MIQILRSPISYYANILFLVRFKRARRKFFETVNFHCEVLRARKLRALKTNVKSVSRSRVDSLKKDL